MRKWWIASASVMLFPLIFGLPLLAYLVGTESGTRELLTRLPEWLHAPWRVARVQGRLVERLELDALQLDLPEARIELGHLTLIWQPLQLFTRRRLQFDVIDLADLRVQLPVDSSTPQPSPAVKPVDLGRLHIPVPLALHLETLTVQRARVEQGEQILLDVPDAKLRARVDDGRLHLQELTWTLPIGTGQVSGDMELQAPFSMRFQAQTQVTAVDGLPGSWQVNGLLQGDAERLGWNAAVRGAVVTDLQGEIHGLLAGDPRWEAHLQIAEASWPWQGAPQVVLDMVAMQAAGDLEHYRLTLDAQARLVAQGLASQWQLTASGDAQSVRIEHLQADLLQGRGLIQGHLAWQHGLTGEFDYQLDDMQLGALVPEWPTGQTLKGQGTLQLAPGQPLRLGGHWTLPGTSAELNLHLTSTLDAIPRLSLAADWRRMQWPLHETPLACSDQGRLALTGSPDAYQLKLDAAVAGGEIPSGTWSLEADGDLERLHIRQLSGQLLEGLVQLRGWVGWTPRPRWELKVEGAKLNPGQHWPEWPGQVALELTTQGEMDAAGQPRGELRVDKADGRLRGYDLKARTELHYAPDQVELPVLTASSGVNQLEARGQWKAGRLEGQWRLEAPDLAALLPKAQGDLVSHGTVSGALQKPRVAADLRARSLSYDTLRIEGVRSQLNLELTPQGAFSGELQGGAVHQGEETLLKQWQLQLAGTQARHSLEANIQAADRSLVARVRGGLNAALDAWQGGLEQLELKDADYGGWTMQHPAPLRYAATQAQMQKACLQRQGANALVCAEGSWDALRGGSLHATVQDIKLAMLRLQQATGTLSAQLDARTNARGELTGSLDGNLSSGMLGESGSGSLQVPHQGGNFGVKLDGTGLQAKAKFTISSANGLEASVQLPKLSGFALRQDQPLLGHLTGHFQDLTQVATLVPQVDQLKGLLEMDLQLSGNLRQPNVKGQLALKSGQMDVPATGMQVRDVNLRLATGKDVEHLMLDGSLRTGQGQLHVQGDIELPQRRASFQIHGQDLVVVNLPEYWATVSPQLQARWQDQLLTLEGEVRIPQAKLEPDLKRYMPLDLFQAAKADEATEAEPIRRRSADVVIRRATPHIETATLPMAVDAKVKLILGQGVMFDGGGLRSRIAGQLLVLKRPQHTQWLPLADGELQLVNGRFTALGQNLDIGRGRIMFNHTTITKPELDINAVRTITGDDRVREAGIHMTGTPETLRWDLYSVPMLEQRAIMSYILSGAGPDDKNTKLGIGRQISPDLYVGYGHNLLNNTNSVNIRYEVSERLGMEAEVGEGDSSVNFSYTLER